MNTLVIIKSAHRYADRRQLIRDTWLKGLPWDYFFALGIKLEGPELQQDEQVFPVSDAFQNIAPKLKAALELGLVKEKLYDQFFIVDDDTFVATSRLESEPVLAEICSEEYDYRGWYRDNGGHGYPLPYIQGSAYFLSRKAAEIVVASKEMVNAIPDDVAVGRALYGKVKFTNDNKFWPGPNCWEQYPSSENGLISTHKCLTSDMKKLYEMWENWNAITNI
jgi:hypothetical protein